MEISPTTVVLVGVVCVGLGFLASILLSTLAEEPEPPSQAGDEAPPGGRKGRYTPVVRVWREKGAGTLIVEMDGKAMTAPDPLTEIQRERLERSVRDLQVWLRMGPTGLEPVDPAPQYAASPQPAASPISAPPAQANLDPFEEDLSRAVMPIPASPPPASAPADSTSAASAPAASAAARKPVAPPPSSAAPAGPATARPAAAAPVSPAAKGKDDLVKPLAAKSMVMQIEDILQEMIAGTQWSQRGVHLLEDPLRGVIVQVGLEHYEGIYSVPDPEIKGIIQTAVQKWESSQ